MYSQIACWRIVAFGLFLATVLATGLSVARDEKSANAENQRPDDLAIAEQLKAAFDAGFLVGPRSAQDAVGRIERLRRVAPADPRIDFVHGLVLAKQSQMKLASAQFEAAVMQAGPAFWPAWKAAIWSHFVEKRYESGLNRLVEFSILVHDAAPATSPADDPAADGSSEITEDQRGAARWIGQLLEALRLVPDAKKFTALIDERQSRVVDGLGDELAFSFEEGRELLRARVSELELAADTARDTAGQLAKRRKLDKQLDAIDKGNPPQTKEEWKKWIDDVLSKFDKQLGQWDREYQALSLRSDALNRSYAQANSLLVAAKANMTMLHHQGVGPVPFVMLKEQMVNYSDQMTAYQVEYNLVVEQMSNMAQLASNLADRRAAAIERYERETGDSIPRNPDLDKWATRVSDKRPRLAAKAAAKVVKKDPAAKKRVPTLKSLLPLEFERERDELLESFGLRPAAASDSPNAAADPGAKSSGKSDRNSASPAEKP
jgi:hypothetical protein